MNSLLTAPQSVNETFKLPDDFIDPTCEFSVMPFWFWNDALDEDEIIRQIDDFEKHGVHGFVIHPRVGLPRDLGWMSDKLLSFYRIAIEEAQKRKMRVILYDEGMYPSGSSSGQVVAENASYACRGLIKVDLSPGEEPNLGKDETLVAMVNRQNGSRLAVIDRKVDSHIRGLHYIDGGPKEDEPPATDILNPEAVRTFIRLVYNKFAAEFSGFFGKTVFAIFTDEPNMLGKRRRGKGFRPGTTGILEHVNRFLGYDFTPHLPALWYDDEPDAEHYQKAYTTAVKARLEETYYYQLYQWCEGHDIDLTGHPALGEDIGPLRYFHIPGQDSVWRWVVPDSPTALEGGESTQGKCASSAALHGRRRRNSNECCGAYGHELTWEEMQWLARWCFVRGTNLLIPHAFYYSVRGPRWDERPPDVGPNSSWWSRYKSYADACRRLSWLNTDGEHICNVAILGKSNHLPWKAAKVCFQNQCDFNYLEERDLLDRAIVDKDSLRMGGMKYKVLIMEEEPDPQTMNELEFFAQSGRVLRYREGMVDDSLIDQIDGIAGRDICLDQPSPALRMRHIRKAGFDWYLLFNEEKDAIETGFELSVKGNWFHVDMETGMAEGIPSDQPVHFDGHELKVIVVEN